MRGGWLFVAGDKAGQPDPQPGTRHRHQDIGDIGYAGKDEKLGEFENDGSQYRPCPGLYPHSFPGNHPKQADRGPKQGIGDEIIDLLSGISDKKTEGNEVDFTALPFVVDFYRADREIKGQDTIEKKTGQIEPEQFFSQIGFSSGSPCLHDPPVNSCSVSPP